MLKLYQYERTWGIPNLSPFCCKIETYLRMAEIDYEIKPALPLGAPKGKLPYIEDNGQALGDSRFIITHLKSTYKDLDKGLPEEKLALSVAMLRFIRAGNTQMKIGKSTNKLFLAGYRLLSATLPPVGGAVKSSSKFWVMAPADTKLKKSSHSASKIWMRYLQASATNPISWVTSPPRWIPQLLGCSSISSAAPLNHRLRNMA